MLGPVGVARLHGFFNVVGGVWPVVHLDSFEAVFGEKVDDWLEYTVGGLLTVIGVSQLAAATPDDWRVARRLGLGTAATLLAIDLVYVPKGRIKWTYLLDAAEEVALIATWVAASRGGRPVSPGAALEA